MNLYPEPRGAHKIRYGVWFKESAHEPVFEKPEKFNIKIQHFKIMVRELVRQ
jgi:hypothetical protein